VREDAMRQVILVGGYGVVGAQVAHWIRRRHPSKEIVLAGRNPARADDLAHRLGAGTARVDIADRDPLAEVDPRPGAVVVGLVNDPEEHLLLAAVRRGLPVLDITRWTERQRALRARLRNERLRAPVVLASGWMAGGAAFLAHETALAFARIETIEISVRFALADRAGPDSVAYMDRLATPFDVPFDGGWRRVRPMTDARRATFPDGRRATVARFDTPDQESLVRTTGAHTVAMRIGYDRPLTFLALRALVRSGAFGLISGPGWARVRRALLYHPGSGAPHDFVVRVVGRTHAGMSAERRLYLTDPQGQAHLTAVFAAAQIERLWRGGEEPGVIDAETHPDPAAVRALLMEAGVRIHERWQGGRGATRGGGGVHDDLILIDNIPLAKINLFEGTAMTGKERAIGFRFLGNAGFKLEL
jgi:hypothetical protein